MSIKEETTNWLSKASIKSGVLGLDHSIHRRGQCCHIKRWSQKGHTSISPNRTSIWQNFSTPWWNTNCGRHHQRVTLEHPATRKRHSHCAIHRQKFPPQHPRNYRCRIHHSIWQWRSQHIWCKRYKGVGHKTSNIVKMVQQTSKAFACTSSSNCLQQEHGHGLHLETTHRVPTKETTTKQSSSQCVQAKMQPELIWSPCGSRISYKTKVD